MLCLPRSDGADWAQGLRHGQRDAVDREWLAVDGAARHDDRGGGDRQGLRNLGAAARAHPSRPLGDAAPPVRSFVPRPADPSRPADRSESHRGGFPSHAALLTLGGCCLRHIFDLTNISFPTPPKIGSDPHPSSTFRDFSEGQPVTLSTWCNAGRTLGCEVPFDIRYTLDGSTPSPSSLNYTRPFRVRSTTMVKAAGFERSSGRQIFAESQSVLVATPKPACVVSDKPGGAARFCSPGQQVGFLSTSCTCPPLYEAVEQEEEAEALLDISVAPLLWDYVRDRKSTLSVPSPMLMPCLFAGAAHRATILRTGSALGSMSRGQAHR